MLIVVRSHDESTLTLRAKSSQSTIYQLKAKVAELKHYPMTALHLLFEGRLLKDGTLADYDIQEGSTLDLVVEQRGD